MKTLKRILSLTISVVMMAQISFSSYQIQVGNVIRTVSDNGIVQQDFDTKKNERTIYDATGTFYQHFDKNGVMDMQYNKDRTGTVVSMLQYNSAAADPAKAYSLIVFTGPGGRDAVKLGGYSATDIMGNLAKLTAETQGIYNALINGGGRDAVNALGTDAVKHISGISLGAASIRNLTDQKICDIFGYKSPADARDEIANIRRDCAAAGADGTLNINFESKGGKIKVTGYTVSMANGLTVGNTDYTALSVADYNNKFHPPIDAQLAPQAQSILNAGNIWALLSASQQLALKQWMITNNKTFEFLTVANLTTALGTTTSPGDYVLSDTQKAQFVAGINALGKQGWGNAINNMTLADAGFGAMANLAQRIADVVAKILTMPVSAVENGQIQLDFSQDGTVGSPDNPTQNVVHIMLRPTGTHEGGIDLETYVGTQASLGGQAWNKLDVTATQLAAIQQYMATHQPPLTFATMTEALMKAAFTSAGMTVDDGIVSQIVAGMNALGKASNANFPATFAGLAKVGNTGTVASIWTGLTQSQKDKLTAYMASQSPALTFATITADLIEKALGDGADAMTKATRNALAAAMKGVGVGSGSLADQFKACVNKMSVLNGSYGNAHNVGSHDPLVSGTIQSIVVINGKSYLVVKASTVDMYDGKGPQAADGEEIYVAVDDATAANIKAQMGSDGLSICISGDVNTSVDGHFTMTMNAGGYETVAGSSPESVAKASDTWKSKNQTFYNNMIALMAPVWAAANANGQNSNWKAGWNFLSGGAGNLLDGAIARIQGFANNFPR
ncbi:MAG: hypothetical protein NTU66_00260 [Elusimicrobia bacterium]|nr:hypothetical protein [Elusimicrobiota bacterium]